VASIVKVGDMYINLDKILVAKPGHNGGLDVFFEGAPAPAQYEGTVATDLLQKLEQLKV
jgi:hypothetical protein